MPLGDLFSNIHSIFTILCNALPCGECWLSDSEIVEETEKSDVDNNAAHQELLDCAIDGASGRDRVLSKLDAISCRVTLIPRGIMGIRRINHGTMIDQELKVTDIIFSLLSHLVSLTEISTWLIVSSTAGQPRALV